MRFLNHQLFAIIAPAVIGLGCAALAVMYFQSYGSSLFLGLPILVSFLAAFFWSFRRRVTFGSAYSIAVCSLLLLGVLILT